MEAIFGSTRGEEIEKAHRFAGKRIMSVTVEDLQAQFERETSDSTKNTTDNYGRNFVEFCCFRVLPSLCQTMKELDDRSLSRLTFDMMLAWESPSDDDHKECNFVVRESQIETIAKEKQEREANEEDDEASLFYSDLMPMLVDVESSVGVEAFTRLGPAVPIIADVVSANFQFETLTAATGGRLPFPVYDKYLKELDKSIQYLKAQMTSSLSSTLNLVKGETVIYIDGTGTTQRVVRHIGGTSWPGRLTLTNYALYFETSGVISYEKPIKFDLSTDAQNEVKPASTGPWGAPLFDKAVIYDSRDIEEPLILEFPELTGSTRRDYWLALIKEVINVHKLVRRFGLDGVEKEEAMAIAVLGVVRLHATRETFQIFPPRPHTFLTFSLSEEMPGGDYVMEALANSLRTGNALNQSENYKVGSSNVYFVSAASLLDNMGIVERERTFDEEKDVSIGEVQVGELTPLESSVQQSREEAKKTEIARASIEGLRAEGISDNGTILKICSVTTSLFNHPYVIHSGMCSDDALAELLSPLMNIIPWFQELLTWQKPLTTASVFILSLLITYMEWIGYAVSALLFMAAGFLMWVRSTDMKNKYDEIVVSTSSDQTTMESVVSAQQALNQVHSAIQATNITLLKLLSIALSKPIEHTNQVILGLLALALTFLIIPFKVIVMGVITNVFTMNLRMRRTRSSERSARRMKEWWDSVPAIPVRLVK
eukprot:Gb_15960 [translate_table: standard]